MDTPGGKQEMNIVNEPGLYSLVLSSKLPSQFATVLQSGQKRTKEERRCNW